MNVLLAILNATFAGLTLLAALAQEPTNSNKKNVAWLFMFFLFFCNAVYMLAVKP